MKDFVLVNQPLDPPAALVLTRGDGTEASISLGVAHSEKTVRRLGSGAIILANTGEVSVRADLSTCLFSDDPAGGDLEFDHRALLAYLAPGESVSCRLASDPHHDHHDLVLQARPGQMSLPWSKPGVGVRAERDKAFRSLGLRDEWEHLTYLLLQHLGLFPRVVHEGHERQPDLLVEIGGVEVPVEVKTFQRNQQEREVADGKSASVSQEIGRRLIKQLSKACGQVRAAAEAGRPSLVIVLDPSSLGHAWPDHIAAAFVGHLTAEVELEDERPVVRDVQRHENRRRVPPGSFRDISAVGVLHSCLTTSPFLQRPDIGHTLAFNLDIYHNPDALVPFSGDSLTGLGVARVAQYRIGDVRSRTAYASLR